MSKRKPIPVTIVSGFLGAGKTTLLNRILSSDHGLRMAVMVNDFGAINIDSQLIVSQTQTSISLANGCICCTVESDLIEQLGRLLDDRANRPQYIVIEASGVSNPSKIANTLRYPQFREALTIDSILTVVDAEQFEHLDGEMARLAMEQLDVADIIVLNKVDCVSREQIQALKARWLYPNARVLESQYGDVPLELILALGAFKPTLNYRPTTTAQAPLATGVRQQDHAAIFESWSFTSERPLALQALRNTLAALPSGIYRAKGVCQIAEVPDQRCVLHLVGSRSEIKPQEGWGGSTPSTQLILIGQRGAINAEAFQAAFEACVGSL